MSKDLKTEQQIYADIGTIIEAYLVGNNYEKWANNVIQWGQPSMQEVPSPAILMNIDNTRKYGWEWTDYIWNSDLKSGSAKIAWFEEIQMAFTFFRDPQDLINPDFDLGGYVSASDMAQRLRAYFLSDFGVSALRAMEYGSRNTSEILNPLLQTDDNIYARTPSFTLTLVRKQEIYQSYTDFTTYEQQKQNEKNNPQNIKIIGV